MMRKNSGLHLFIAIFIGLFAGLFVDSYLTPYFPAGWMGALLGFIVASLVIYILVGLAQHRRHAGLALDYAYEAASRAKMLAILKHLFAFSPVSTPFRFASA